MKSRCGQPCCTGRGSTSGPARGGIPDNGQVPRYYRAKRQILALRERLDEGAALPSERVLCARLGVARATLRQAVLHLVLEGWVDSQQGRGSFVVGRPKIIQPLCSTTQPGQDILTDRTWTMFERRQAGCELARELGVHRDDEVLHFECVRGSGDEVLAIESAYLPAARFRGFTGCPARHRSLHDELRSRFGVQQGGADQRTETVHVSPREATLLGTLAALPALVVNRTAWDTAGEPFEQVRTLYRGDRLSLANRLGSVERRAADSPAKSPDSHNK
ncbi:GntR family transcriptional regulator [Amycolatopsis sp. WAC 04197]|uniref:GntR family transcriptional regulator n=1 Tax=Amycolatopsis sp. WAC 04197 TaxID=2203199 RepID=UPI000F7B3EFB|nr:GntR family transcriptional regulator [Amycolatopsis sp. WAC 04197]RSN39923.1 GntR family transcriptional regulator [Amycolatopsis sp. WAC 04197]